jgi:hypothetical protein
MPLLDVANRIVYFSFPAQYVYFGFHGQAGSTIPPEVYLQYPYTKLNGFLDKPLDCARETDGVVPGWTTQFSPICRPWFWNAYKSVDVALTKVDVKSRSITFNTLDTDANTGMSYLSLSIPLYAGNDLVGVAAFDAALSQMSRVLRETALGEQGYVYVIDRAGNSVVHPEWTGAPRKIDCETRPCSLGSADDLQISQGEASPLYLGQCRWPSDLTGGAMNRGRMPRRP